MIKWLEEQQMLQIIARWFNLLLNTSDFRHAFNIVTFNFSTNIFCFGSVCTRQGTAHGHYWIREFEARENFVLFINLSLPSTIYSEKPQIFQHLAYLMFHTFLIWYFFQIQTNKCSIDVFWHSKHYFDTIMFLQILMF